MNYILRTLFGLVFVGLVSCGASLEEPDPGAPAIAADRFIRDADGRALILQGANDLGDAKNNLISSLTRADVDRRALQWGFNSARYLLQWQNVEPRRGEFSHGYLDRVEEQLDWYAAHGMHVVLDMHQDIYGPAVNGNGAPAWATETDGHVPVQIQGSGIPWWVQNIDYAVTAAWRNFWEYDRYRYLQDHYIQAWQFVAERFKDHPAVIGYDLMNEPFAGDVGDMVLDTFESGWLSDFYARLIPGIRVVDTDAWIFYEPQSLFVVFGLPSGLRYQPDPREGEPRLVLAPHLYPFGYHEGAGLQNPDVKQIEAWELHRTQEMDRLQTPLFVGEFGGSDKQAGSEAYYRQVMKVFERTMASWATWDGGCGTWGPCYSDGSDADKMFYLVRPYPRATAGTPKRFSFDYDTREFVLEYTNREGAVGPTEIFVPARHYPDGWELEMSDEAGTWRQDWDAERSILSVWHDPEVETHMLRITPD